jgi:phage FluMu protein Com
MKNEDNIKDWRSTGRRKARKALFNAYVEFKCCDCGKTSIEPPKDAPPWFEEIWPEENRVLDYSLQADHESKDMQFNDVSELNWRCASCHKLHDSQTEKGTSTIQTSFW